MRARSDRLREILTPTFHHKSSGELNISAAANAIGVKPASVRRWLENNEMNIRSTLLDKISLLTGTSKEWIEKGTGGKYSRANFTYPSGENNGNIDLYQEVHKVPALSWGEVESGKAGPVEGDMNGDLLCPVPHGKRTFSLIVRGRAMEQDYHEGVYIFIDPDSQYANNSDVLIQLRSSGEALFRRLHIEGADKYFMATNPSWTERIKFDDNVNVIGACLCAVKIPKN